MKLKKKKKWKVRECFIGSIQLGILNDYTIFYN